ncbi:hypothetical protein H8356DRAFT_1619410 [Neocallimastix lanati (nom. inval.)]|jgi:hypothetical protein|uniref:Uncharacterized protein n=1 Tax=Neocallimastix californiae TaxID=1754190 RepID=A0A1Y2DU33_9FUNG|nr:hypothetical protein H8356DRAFT_1619410 [Neocallimastix sp. JGI-2020a]ORY62780.1 hypothetical protein LY90DRAFT_701004 [Neocallimastix californiae]|eukprot:ORY62780.1 hypothetical protein LY90DRAFT_701004 [Neocallimastix californiae]
MRILEFLILTVLGVYINSVFGFKWPDHNWNINFRIINENLVDNTQDELVIKSIDAGLFNKDIDEETYCRYTFSETRKMHYILCHATIKNYSKRNTAKKYYFFIDFGRDKDHEPRCDDGYDINSSTEFYFDLINDKDKKMTKYLGELKFNKFATEKTLPFEGGNTKKYFRIMNDYCYYALPFEKVEILTYDPGY